MSMQIATLISNMLSISPNVACVNIYAVFSWATYSFSAPNQISTAVVVQRSVC